MQGFTPPSAAIQVHQFVARNTQYPGGDCLGGVIAAPVQMQREQSLLHKVLYIVRQVHQMATEVSPQSPGNQSKSFAVSEVIA